ncbi:restriction endonuclease subunit S [Lactobacillus delbrueckii subsp. bulgaricus]|nr:hypothetical protein [Lactobacillus delbrueckii subsp. bulgaricus]
MRYKISDLLELIMDFRGKTPKKLGLDWTENKNDILAISAKNIKDGALININKSHYGDEQLYKKWMKFGDIHVGDILMTSEAPLGETYLVTTPMRAIISQRVFLLRFKADLVDPWYMYSYMKSTDFKNKITEKSSGTTVVGIKQKELLNIDVDMPDMFCQQRIGSIFKTIQSKLDLNSKINDNLLDVAQLIFNSMFPNVNYGTQTIGELTKNFDKFRKPLSKKQRIEIQGNYRYIGATSVNDYISKYNFDGIYLLLAEDGSVQDNNGFPILQYVFGKFWPNNHTHVLQGNNISTEWLYLFFRQHKVSELVTGAVQPKISQSNLNKISITAPTEEEKEIFSTRTDNIFSLIRQNELQSTKLLMLKNLLLSKYF